jgi:uncharacterized protein YqgV (UPF0045/DUF77 family)
MVFARTLSGSMEAAPKALSFASAAYARAIGALIIFKQLIPLLVLGLLVTGVWFVARSVNAEFERLNTSLQPKFERVEAEIDKLRDEGRRLADKVAKIKNEGVRVAAEIKSAVEPIRQSLLGISNTVGAISATMESVVNAIVRVLRKIPFVRGIGGIHFPRIDIPGFSLPHIDIDLGLDFDMAAVEALKQLSGQIADEAEATVETLKKIWLTWWWTFKIMVFLLLCWLLLTFVGMLARFWQKLRIGLQLLLGHSHSASLALL